MLLKTKCAFFLFKFNCAWFVWFGFAHQEDNNTPSSKLKNPIKIGKLHFYGIFGEMNLISSQSLLDNIGIKKLKNVHQYSFPLLSLFSTEEDEWKIKIFKKCQKCPF